jgi:hypothetical protein
LIDWGLDFTVCPCIFFWSNDSGHEFEKSTQVNIFYFLISSFDIGFFFLINFVVFFDLVFIRLSRSYDLDHKFDELTRINLSLIIQVICLLC